MAPPPVVLLHGQPGSAEDWIRVRRALHGRADLLVPDRPGWDGRRAPGGLAENARAVADLLEEHGIERATLVGHSFGAAVACWTAAELTDRVAALVLVAPAANTASLLPVDRWLIRPIAGPVLTTAMLGVTGLVLAPGRTRRRLAALLRVPEPYLRHASARLRSRWAWEAFGVEQRALVEEMSALEAKLGTIDAPTRIVIGSRDRIVPMDSAVELARQIRSARFDRIEGAGHLLPLLHPERIAAAILAVSEA